MSNRSNDYIYAVRDTKGVSPYNAPRARKIFPKTPQKKTTIHFKFPAAYNPRCMGEWRSD
jgi:hypothetical protein